MMLDLAIDVTDLEKARKPTKYKRRWRGKDGKWHYEYDDGTVVTRAAKRTPEQRKADEKAEKERIAAIKRLSDKKADEALTALGDWLYTMDDVREYNAMGLNKMDHQTWRYSSANLSLAKKRKLLAKYKRQIIEGKGEKTYYALGLGDDWDKPGTEPHPAHWQWHKHFGNFNWRIDLEHGDKRFYPLLNLKKKWGMFNSRDRDTGVWWTVVKDHTTLDWPKFKAELEEVMKQPVDLPDEMPSPPKEPSPEELSGQMDGPGSFDKVRDFIRTKEPGHKNLAAVKWDKESDSYEFVFPIGEISKLFSNKRGMLPSVVRWDTSRDPWTATVFDHHIAKLAMEKMRKINKDIHIAEDGWKEGTLETEQREAALQVPIPEVAEKLNPEFKLFPYQNEGVRFLQKTEGRCILGDEMGLGKTLQCLSYLVAEPSDPKAVVIVPKTVRRQWLEEADKFFPGQFQGSELDSARLLKIKKNMDKVKQDYVSYIGAQGDDGDANALHMADHYTDHPEEIPEDLAIAHALGLLNGNLATINYESLTKFAPYLKAAGFDTMIIDESHRMKNPDAKVTKAIKNLSRTMPRRILMSGTAIKNRRGEFATQFDLVAPGMFGGKKDIESNMIGELWDKMRPFYLARQKSKVLKDLPDKTTTITQLPADKKYLPDLPSSLKDVIHNASAMTYIDALKAGESEGTAKTMAAEAADQKAIEIEEALERARSGEAMDRRSAEDLGDRRSPEQIVTEMYIRKDIASFTKTLHALAYAKAKATVDFVKENLEGSDSNFLVFTESKVTANKIAEELGPIAKLYTGDVPTERREQIKSQFHPHTRREDETARVIVATRPTLAEGANLTSIDKVVFNDLPWTPASIRQAEDRTHRPGQKNPVNVYWIQAEENAMDARVAAIIHRKALMHKKQVEGGQFSPEELKWAEEPVKIGDLVKELTGGGETGPTEETVPVQTKTGETVDIPQEPMLVIPKEKPKPKQKQKKAEAPAPKTVKLDAPTPKLKEGQVQGDLFKSMTLEDLAKARPHKYIRRRKVKGKWQYDYGHGWGVQPQLGLFDQPKPQPKAEPKPPPKKSKAKAKESILAAMAEKPAVYVAQYNFPSLDLTPTEVLETLDELVKDGKLERKQLEPGNKLIGTKPTYGYIRKDRAKILEQQTKEFIAQEKAKEDKPKEIFMGKEERAQALKHVIEHDPGDWMPAKLNAAKVYELLKVDHSSAQDAVEAFLDHADSPRAKKMRKNNLRKLGIKRSNGAWVLGGAPSTPKPKAKKAAPKKETKAAPKKTTKKTTSKKRRAKKPKLGDLQEVGEHIFGSRKDLAEIAMQIREGKRELTSEDLAKLDYGDAAFLVTKKNLVPVHTRETLKGLGQSPGAAHLGLVITSFIGAKPPDSKVGRENYASEVRTVVASLQRVRSMKDVVELHKEWTAMHNADNRRDVQEFEDDREGAHARAKQLQEETGITHEVYRTGYYRDKYKVVARDPRPFESLGKRFETFINTFHEPGNWYSFGGSKGSKVYREALAVAQKAESLGDDGWDVLDGIEGAKKVQKKKATVKRGWSGVKDVRGEVVREGATVTVKDADPKRIKKTFDLPNVQYGQWLSQADREYHTKALEEAYHDFSEILGVPAAVMSLNGRIGISMGGRGRGKAAAHYEPNKKIINLTKFSGGGTLAHEWGHAMDNVLAEHHYQNTTAGGTYLSESTNRPEIPPGVRNAMQAVMKAMTKAPDPAKARAAHKEHSNRLYKEANDKVKEHNALQRESNEIRRKPASKENMDRRIESHQNEINRYKEEIKEYEKKIASRTRGGHKAEMEISHRKYWISEREKKIARIKELGFKSPEDDAKLAEMDAKVDELRREANSLRAVYNAHRKTDAEASDYLRSANMIGKKYWGSTREMFARAFEAFTEDALMEANRLNTYLVDGTTVKYPVDHYLPSGERAQPYPHGAERKAIYKAMKALMNELKNSGELKKALEWISGLADSPRLVIPLA